MLGSVSVVENDRIMIVGDNGKQYEEFLTEFDDTPKYSFSFKVGQRVWFKELPGEAHSLEAEHYASNISIDTGNVFESMLKREAEYDDWSIEDCKKVYDTTEFGLFSTPTTIIYNAKEYIGAMLQIQMHKGKIVLDRYDRLNDGTAENERFPKESKISIDLSKTVITSCGGMEEFDCGFITFESSAFGFENMPSGNKIEITMWSLEQYNYVLMLLKYTYSMMNNTDIFDKIEYKEYSFDELEYSECEEFVKKSDYMLSFRAGYDCEYENVPFIIDAKKNLLTGHTDEVTIKMNFNSSNISISSFASLGSITIMNAPAEVSEGINSTINDGDYGITLSITEDDYATANKINVFIKYMISNCCDNYVDIDDEDKAKQYLCNKEISRYFVGESVSKFNLGHCKISSLSRIGLLEDENDGIATITIIENDFASHNPITLENLIVNLGLFEIRTETSLSTMAMKIDVLKKDDEQKRIVLAHWSGDTWFEFDDEQNYRSALSFFILSYFPKLVDTNMLPINDVLVEKSEKNTEREEKATVISHDADNPYDRLNNLIGLESIKADVNNLINLMKMQAKRKEQGLKPVPVSLHLVFSGNPGTGKTTIARILAQIYKEIGVLTKGQLIEVDRSGLVAGYVGQTAIKTQEKINEALGGVLFIDEAYTLVKDGQDYGQEAIDTILKAMEDNRENFVVIVAGYDGLMQKFINSNPGLKSRFNKYIHFPDYSAAELVDIFNSICKEYQYELSEAAEEVMKKKIYDMESGKNENFANARDIRNMFENVITKMATRVAFSQDADIMTITDDDFN